MTTAPAGAPGFDDPLPEIKCVVWDLDDTIWDGILLESDAVALRSGIGAVIDALDRRGILQSIASRNDPGLAMAKLAEFGLDHYFLHPQIGWGAKSASVTAIARALNIGTNTIAFVDDQPFERDEVVAAHPHVRAIDADEYLSLLERGDMNPRFQTDDSRRRREMYIAEDVRRSVESEAPTTEDFLASLDMVLTLSDATRDDLARVSELTVRTNQLNSTGVTFSYEELDALRASDAHRLLIAGLDDRYGTYGKIGLGLIEYGDGAWRLPLLLMSCRVMSRGAGKVLLSYILQEASASGAVLEAEFVRTDRNRLMYLTYKMAGFTEASRDGDHIVLRYDRDSVDPYPSYVKVVEPERTA